MTDYKEEEHESFIGIMFFQVCREEMACFVHVSYIYIILIQNMYITVLSEH